MSEFVATHASAVAEGGYQQLAFAEDEGDAGRYVIVQLADAFDAQDHALGMAGIYLEIDDPACAGYGKISGFGLEGRLLVVAFDAESLGLPASASPLRIDCRDPSRPFDAVVQMLRDMAARMSLPLTDA